MSKEIPFKSKGKSKSLREKLSEIYSKYVNLDTTCEGRCECCNVAMPALNRCEAEQLMNDVWATSSKSEKIDMICKSVEYFFRYEYEKFGRDTLIKPCMILNDEGRCTQYASRPLSCRLYGLWPEDVYERRVDKFQAAYEEFGLEREDLPLNTQCPYVTRVDDSVEITEELIDDLYARLDMLDVKIGNYTEAEIEEKHNYRAWHDWVLYFTFGEQWLSDLTQFMLAANKETIEAQVEEINNAVRREFAKELPTPNIGDVDG